MKRLLALLGALVLASAAASAQGTPRPTLIILGVPHFDNPARDTANARVPDVLTPARQREIAAIVNRLAAFRPTRVAVEWPAERQNDLDRRYADYRAGRRAASADEREQIGLRLAAQLGLPRVDAIDWNDNPPGADSSYDYPAWASAHGRGPEWRAWVDHLQAEADARARLMACTPVSAWVRRVNGREYRRANHGTYFYIAQLGDRIGDNPGAAWVGTWYVRNFRILNNLRAIAPAPSDRVVVIYGAGHGFLLDELARESGAFTLADTIAYLPRSPGDAWTRCPGRP